ncbi:pulmonary surfactant-associated protein D-like [Crassostrea angulata]|uniref:pulmonary surfactant-associated protein D-like n=1 Tax=Magallana angulata TaxID=2784310 RepID=UPI0022B1A56B|nr:pulmonary surfactant-associated protein D-like [Crassostrea angulata]
MRFKELIRIFCQVIGVASYLAIADANVTNTEFTRIENAVLEDLYNHTQQTTSLNAFASCAVLCSQTVGCKSFTWKKDTFSCILLQRDIKRKSGDPPIPSDIALYTKYYRSCADFGYEEINDISEYCFKYNAVKKPYTEAQNTCQYDGGHLVRISTSAKHGYIRSFMNLKSKEAILIDGTDLIDGTWRLSDGRLMYLNWLPGEPNNKYEHWLMMNAFGQQNDIMRNVSLFFICERQLNL